jgi:DNA-binding GntR family transcriptional regulator
MSRSEYVYASLRAGILSGELEPGELVREEALAEYFEVSRTPVREALLRLQAEALLETGGSRGGLVVTTVSLQEALETYVVREALEGLVARLVAIHASNAELEELELMHQAMERAVDDTTLAARLLDDFHDLMYSASRNRLLQVSARNLRDTLGRFRVATLASAERRREHVVEKRELLEALKRRDPELAEATARQQIRRAREIGLEMLRALHPSVIGGRRLPRRV